MINTRGLVSLKELEHSFPEVSSMTLRRDLAYLDAHGDAIRVRRGARALRAHGAGETEPVYAMRQVENLPAKVAIADAALGLLKPGATVYLDAGTTIMCLARKMPDGKYSVVTQAPNIALEIAKHQFTDVFMLGGYLLKSSLANTGHATLRMLEAFNIDLAILCTSGYVHGVGFTCGNQEEGELKRSLLRRARANVMLMDQTKIGRSMAHTFATLRDIGGLIVDGPLAGDAAERMLEEIEQFNIPLTICEKERK